MRQAKFIKLGENASIVCKSDAEICAECRHATAQWIFGHRSGGWCFQVPVREMKCHPLVEPEPQSTQQLGTTKAGTEEVGSKTSTQEEEQEEEEEEGEEDDQIVTEIHMDDLDEAALDQLISSIIRMGASDDADADFLDEENESDDEEDLPSGRTGRTEL